MTRFSIALATVLLILVSQSEGARILVVFTRPSFSHFFLGNVLVKGLVNKGHNVTFISSFGSKLDKKNLKNVVLTGFKEQMEDKMKEIMAMSRKSAIDQFHHKSAFSLWITNTTLNHTNVQDLLKSNEKFDLVIMDTFLSEAHIGFAHHYDCPFIVFSTMGSNVWVNHLVGNEAPPSYVPEMLTGYTGQMNFWQRTKNFFITYMTEFIYHVLQLPQQDILLHKHFPTAPPLKEIIFSRLSLIFLNSHPSITKAKPSVPNMIEIGGFHVAEPKPLPKDLKIYLDDAKEGFILLSMGSNIKSSMCSNETRETIMKVLAKLPYKILWKFEDDHLPGKPDNIKIGKWLPQNDILAHPNLKLFITHGGILSTTEAVYHGVPIVGIPFLGDQVMNMATSENLGIGKAVEFKDITYEKLQATLVEVLNNKSYKEAAKRRSALLRDQPIRPFDAAMYWIEYALRHKNLDHLKVGAIHLAWYQIKSFDAIAFISSVLLVVILILYLIVRKFCCSRNRQEKFKQN